AAVSYDGIIAGGAAGAGGIGYGGRYSAAPGRAGIGIDLLGGGTVVNGSVSDGTAQITGRVGIYVERTAGATLINYGTILGSSGTAVSLGGGNDLLVLEPGSEIIGAIGTFSTGDTIDLAGVVATGLTYSDSVLTLFDNSIAVDSLRLPGSFTTSSFHLAGD